VELGGFRTVLGVSMRKDEALLGAFTIYRQEVRPFTEKHIALLQNFAAQAVIAMENARLLTETREGLEQQTATAEVLKAISRSTFDLDAVLQTVVSAAHRLCRSDYSVIFRQQGDEYRWAAGYGISAEYEERERRAVIRPGTDTVIGRAVLAGHAVQIADAKTDPLYQGEAENDARAMLGVPLLRDGVAIGGMGLARNRVEPFTDKQVELVTTFADQAVIAMENARLLTETREALAQQTATAEVLQVINSSPGDLAPVFDAILEKAHTLCGAAHGSLQLYDGETLHAVATHAVSDKFAEVLRQGYRASDSPASGALIEGKRFIQIADCAKIDHPVFQSAVELSGIRTVLFVPLRRDDAFLGLISAARLEVQPFSDKEIALLENFAAQAVIAMENARLLTETREALEQQTATAEVLQVINSSPGDLAPVFETMLERALRLCGGSFGELRTYDGERFRLAATHGVPTAYVQHYLRNVSGIYRPGTGPARILAGERVVHIPDLVATEPYRLGDPDRVALVELGGARAYLLVPLLRDTAVLGYIMIYRKEVGSFSDKQIALLENFAAQAVIAMENARLLTETREALEQQTATAEVLQVVNSSPGDLAPVFETMLEKATTLCDAAFGIMLTWDGQCFHRVAFRGASAELIAALREPTRPVRGTMAEQIVNGVAMISAADIREESAYRIPGAPVGALVDIGGARSYVAIALRKDDALLGLFSIYRQEVRPFSDKQIALLQNFAAQAVIAMENARLLNELQDRTRDLEEALEYQTATSDVLKVISRSTFDLQPVLQTVLDTAVRLCRAGPSEIFRLEGDGYRFAVGHGMTPEYEALERTVVIHPDPGTLVGRTALERRAVHVLNAWTDPLYSQKEEARVGNFRTMLGVPLMREGEVAGVIALSRRAVEPFSEREIQLVTTFADQAVIAIENTRLITETREALEQQTATAEVLQVINSSPGNLAPVYAAILEKAHTLCDVTHGSLQLFDGEMFRAVAVHGVSEATAERLQQGYRPGPNLPNRRLLDGDQFAHILDLAEIDDPVARRVAELGGVRTTLCVALRKDDALLGQIVAARQEVRPFTDKQIALLQNFAAQAVIAIENARLLTETREALEQQTATAEVLQVINSSPGNLAPVYAAILEKAHNLCGITVGTLQPYDGAKIRTVAQRGVTGRFAELLQEPYAPLPGHPASRLLGGERIVHIIDHGMGELAKQQPDNPRAQASAQLGLRTTLWVPLRKDVELLGYISAFRQEVRPFSEKEIALLESFAAQAVIAMDNARLLDEIRRRQAELRVTFDNMGDGVAMFDAELRLAAWNRNFQQLLDLPDDFVNTRPRFADYFNYLAERGEYASTDLEAELKSRLDDPEREMRFERTRPDGRVIEVRHNPVPGGGFVLIYGDVTERKRAEAEIRTARDAAEKALADLKTAQASLIHAEKMASLGQLTAGIAHEIKNPLNFVNNFAGLSVELLDELKDMAAPGIAALDQDTRAEIGETIHMLTGNLDKIAEHGRRADGIVQSMLAHSRGNSGERQKVDLNELVDEALNLAYHGMRAQDQGFNITLERDFAAVIPPVELVHPCLYKLDQQRLSCRPTALEACGRRGFQARAEGGDSRSRRRRRGSGTRQWHRHPTRGLRQAVPAVLHDQAGRRRHGAWTVDQLRHRHPAAWRHHRGRQPSRRVRRIHRATAAHPARVLVKVTIRSELGAQNETGADITGFAQRRHRHRSRPRGRAARLRGGVVR
jgi:GAF domain-containing protein